MDTVIQQFRTAMFGFNRQDVQQYVEQTAGAHLQELARLREQLEQAEKRGGELEAALADVQSERSGAAEEEARVRASLEESTHALSKLRGELSQTESKLVVARQELERLKEQVSAMKPMAENYAQLKERVATVELDAHCKAQTTVDEAQAEAERVLAEAQAETERVLAEAQAEAERVRSEIRAWLDGVLARYNRLRHGMAMLLAQARALEELDETVRGLRALAGPEQPQRDT